jgi:hypothetical protein
MGQQPQRWEPATGEKLWLSMLIEAMDEVSRPEIKAVPCEGSVLAAMTMQLERPVSPYVHRAQNFRFLN